MNKVRRSQKHVIITVIRSPGNAENTNTVETMVLLEIYVELNIITPHISIEQSM